MNCVVCGVYNDGSHKCAVITENRIEGARMGHADRADYPVLYGSRLSEGFARMNESGDYNE